jgi:hypothetical protein
MTHTLIGPVIGAEGKSFTRMLRHTRFIYRPILTLSDLIVMTYPPSQVRTD